MVRSIDDGEFSVLVCDSCGLGVTDPIPGDLAPYYENYYGGRHSFSANHRAKRRLARVRQFVDNGRILDIGYGEGTFLIEAVKAGFECVGVERNRRGDEPFLTFVDLGDVAGKFDAITMWHSLEHMTEPDTMLDRINILLKDDGSLFIAVPNFGGRQAQLFGRDWLHLDLPRHLFHFTPQSLRSLLEKHGFTVTDTWHHESEYDIMGWSQSILNKLTGTRNVYFNTLTGKETSAGALSKVAHFVAGSVLSTFATPLVLLDIVTKRGGTLVVRATKNS
ncbi:MAG TPA: class I SAM-dependent methyltransferase [Pyrinomonadaceae bacterium]|nr:class I SAM-dependent methyltransferase [Pyrinomonadaceae bacterium]